MAAVERRRSFGVLEHVGRRRVKRGTVAALEAIKCMTLVCIAAGDGWLLSLEEIVPEEHGHRSREECV